MGERAYTFYMWNTKKNSKKVNKTSLFSKLYTNRNKNFGAIAVEMLQTVMCWQNCG